MLGLKEDKRVILVGTRRSGKTTELIEMCLEKILDGKDVLYATNNDNMIKFTKDMFLRHSLDKFGSLPKYSARSKTLTFPNKSSIAFRNLKELREHGRGNRQFENCFKVYDEDCWDTLDFDVVSVTGTCKEV